ncbi:SMC family ATPase [Nocardioides terrisoli]|uniref:SMC family ATPase n=1 Tax=Nocardioides terrisoli TaxID=3388267 RepID=UPI00287BA80E|nr:SMC family ATPase [Nocardioides marmorisolisilvae]
MRLHRLTITAFGPFAGSVEVDFDALSETGLFLLTGVTGAGKSSVLDAVCFGLFGEVPGDRNDARHLRSDHADPQAAPEIVLTFSVAGRTLRLTRSPAWERPKRRGTGTTRQPARVVVEERVDGQWIGLTTRLDDAGLLISRLLGMTCTQFTQVALLPQGRFQAFLRASSAERHAVLQRLFCTDRFERVERWLVDHRLTLRRDSQVRQERIAGLVHRIQEAATCQVPADWDLHDLSGPAGDGALAAWAATLTVSAGSDAAEAAAALADAEAALATAKTSAESDRRRDEHRLRGHDAAQRLAALADSEDLGRAMGERIAGHHRAAPVLVRVERAVAARARLEEATQSLARARQAADIGPEVSSSEVERRCREAADAVARAEAARPRQDVLEQARRALHDAQGCIAKLEQDLARASGRLADVPERHSRLLERQHRASEAARRLPELEVEMQRATAGKRAAGELVVLRSRVEAARTALGTSIDEAQLLRDRYQDAREARIGAMAAELAGGLASGCSCPVCGSLDHPAPAHPSGTGSREQEELARRAYEDAETVRMVRAEALAALEARLPSLTELVADEPVAAWTARLEDVSTALAAARAEAQLTDDLAEEVRALDDETAELRDVESAARLELVRAESTARSAADRVGRLETELAELLGDFDSIDALVAAHEAEISRLTTLVHALGEHHHASQAAQADLADARSAAADAGFESLHAVRDAVLAPEELAATEHDLAERARVEAAVTATLAEPEVVSALDGDAPDLEAATAALQAAEAARREALVAARSAARCHERLDRLAVELDAELAAWAPLREAVTLASSLSAFVEGKGADNPLRMRLSAYVLGERLRQVVAAANARLERMSAARYALEHSDARGVGDRRGGLSLMVRDDWSGVLRDPATLSGGETFVVSLALALGLADTVSDEAGGTDIDTLFIDEGFGSLDADTLEDVMDTLDTLREGGRVVGVVSHVAELRDRITTRLDVHKGRAGSQLQLVSGAG